MAWLQKALETYEENVALAGKVEEGRISLLPLYHISIKADFEITINQNGDFIKADIVDKNDAATIIPACIKSAERTSHPNARPLCDILSYIAGDFSKYFEGDYTDRYKDYLEKLRTWAESDHAPLKVKAIFAYVSKATVIEDLLRQEGLLAKDKAGNYHTKYANSLVRFRVNDAADLTVIRETWKDSALMAAYIAYYNKEIGNSIQFENSKFIEDTCYLTGKQAIITATHPKGIVSSSYNAKLISAGDDKNFTYKDLRFQNSADACVISYEASQKAHAALSWLSASQGVSVGSRRFIAWTIKGKEVKPLKKAFTMFRKNDAEIQLEPKTMPEFRLTLSKLLHGYANDIKQEDGSLENVNIIGFDVTSKKTGRLSVVYYNEISGSDFLDRIQYWNESCKWYLRDSRVKGDIICTMSIYELANCAYGTERNGNIETDEKILKGHMERLMVCMLNKQPLPWDLMHALYVKASSRSHYSKWWNWEKVLSAACAAITKYHCYDWCKDILKLDEDGSDFDMELNKYFQNDRSYLFGKLLAVLEKVESHALSVKDVKSQTNAERLYAAYVSHPMTTWKNIDISLTPYFQIIGVGSTQFYKAQIAEITEALTKCCAEKGPDWKKEMNRTLEETYLLGYYLMRKELYKKNNHKDNENESVEANE